MKLKQVVKLWVFLAFVTMLVCASMHLLYRWDGRFFPLKVYPVMFVMVAILIPVVGIGIAALDWWMKEDEK